MKGTVKWFNNKKGYGFVIGEDGKDYFLHYSSINGKGYRTVQDAAAVEFDPVTTEKGDTATSVTCIAE